MDKSSINKLQEIAIKEGCIPMYTYINANNNGSCSQFVCKVTCKTLSTSGSARNKKEAKLIAAENMLSLITCSLQQMEHRATSKAQSPVLLKTMYKNLQDDKNQNVSYPPLEKLLNSSPNYVGLLQELCTKHKLRVLPTYKVLDARGPCHMKTFIVEASVEFLRETGTAHCKKTAKQEAAKKLLTRLRDLNILPAESIKKSNHSRQIFDINLQTFDLEISTARINETELPVAKVSEKAQPISVEHIPNSMPNLAIEKDNTNPLSIVPITKNQTNRQMLEDDLRKLDIKISDFKISEPTIPIAQLSEKAQSIYIASTSDYHNTETRDLVLKDHHCLFKRRYSDKISDSLKTKMQMICESNICNSHLIHEVKRDIQKALGVELKLIEQYSNEIGIIIICLRLLSTPIITQCGIGKTVYDAENRAICEISNTILNFLK